MTVFYTANFLRQFKKLPRTLQQEAKEKIELFKKNQHQPSLRVHKLKGHLRRYWSFSVNYSYRIVYEYDSSTTIALLAIGDHSVYQ